MGTEVLISQYRKSTLALGAVLLTLLAAASGYSASTVDSANAPPSVSSTATSPDIVIGFVGGFVRHDDPHHGPVKLAQRLRETYPANVSISTFENRHRKDAYRAIVRLLDANHDGVLSDEEKKSARIMLFGHSWGASAAVALARDLHQQSIPVLLTIQVDSVAKIGQNDAVIPANVSQAVNFYQPHGLIHGRQKITAADPAHTEVLGNYGFDYRKQPVACVDGSRLTVYFERDHLESECDPRIWSQVETLIRSRLSESANPRETVADSSPQLSGKK